MRRIPLVTVAALAVLLSTHGRAGAAEGGEPSGSEADHTVAVIVDLVDLGVPGDAPIQASLLDLSDGIETTGVLESLDLMAADVTLDGLAALESSASVASVRTARDDLQLTLDESTATVGATDFRIEGYSGEGRVVAVIDSGVDDDHPGLVDADLGSSVVAQGCFLDGISDNGQIDVVEQCDNGERRSPTATPCVTIPLSCTHGTAVAGVISGDDAALAGVAPDAGIIALRVTAVVDGDLDATDPEERYRTYIPEAGVLAALEEVYALRDTFDIAAVNLSLGGSPQGCEDAVWEDVIDRLASAGIAVVAASGNQGWVDAVSFPACLPGVVAVGATDAAGAVAGFSNTSADLDLLAPGGPIMTTVLDSFDPSGFADQTGTSFSAPHVAAALALVDERLPSEWSVARTRNLLRVAGSMVERTTPNPFDHDPRYPELRLGPLVDFVPFVDAVDGYWVEAADWAKVRGVSTGIGTNSFVPDGSLTRAQAVTFLWRFMGSPDHGNGSVFDDVATGEWYTQAVAWASAVGVTTGTAPGRFSPDEPVTRGQLATFMWRTAGQPSPAFGSGFRDVAPGAFYATAVAWMAENGVTTGTTPFSFSPGDTVSRAQMVTFEFRLADAPAAWTGAVAPPDLALF
ncbi:MAG: S8 family serine peptidase [Acidimicrobiales bacterium]